MIKITKNRIFYNKSKEEKRKDIFLYTCYTYGRMVDEKDSTLRRISFLLRKNLTRPLIEKEKELIWWMVKEESSQNVQKVTN